MIQASRRLLHVFPGFGTGGIQVRFCALANAFGAEFHHLIVSLNGELECARRLEEGVPHDTLAFSRAGIAGQVAHALRTIRQAKADLMITYNWGSMLWAAANALAGHLDHVHCEDGFGPEESTRQLARRVYFRRLFLRNATSVVVPSKVLMDIARNDWSVPTEKLVHLPNGIDVGKLRRRGAAMPDDRIETFLRQRATVVTVAALRPEKNIARLIDAFSLVVARCPAQLAIVGDGPERERLEAMVAQKGLAEYVLFTGAQRDPAPILARSAIFALSSDTEQMPLTVLEAMAMSLPIAAVAVGDVKAMVADNCRPYIVNPGDGSALGDAIHALVLDPEMRRRVGEANCLAAEGRYSMSSMLDGWHRIFSTGAGQR